MCVCEREREHIDPYKLDDGSRLDGLVVLPMQGFTNVHFANRVTCPVPRRAPNFAKSKFNKVRESVVH